MTTTVLTIVVLIIAICIGSLIYGVQKAKKKIEMLGDHMEKLMNHLKRQFYFLF